MLSKLQQCMNTLSLISNAIHRTDIFLFFPPKTIFSIMNLRLSYAFSTLKSKQLVWAICMKKIIHKLSYNHHKSKVSKHLNHWPSAALLCQILKPFWWPLCSRLDFGWAKLGSTLGGKRWIMNVGEGV